MEDETVSLERVIRTIEPVRRLQLVILDACRDNPFVRSMRRTFVSRSLRSGHGDIDERALPPNTLIAYAQKAGLTAEDGDGADSHTRRRCSSTWRRPGSTSSWRSDACAMRS